MKVVVLTTSYPRFDGDAAGRFVADAVERLRARDVNVEIVSPASFQHFGIAFGAGIAGNLRRRPWSSGSMIRRDTGTMRPIASNCRCSRDF